MPKRLEQLASVIRLAVQNVLTQGLNDPRVRGLISVTKVEVSADLGEARVFVSILPAAQSELTMHGLRSAAGHIQSEIAKEVAARRMPRLEFRLDSSLKKQAAIDTALRSGGPSDPRSEEAIVDISSNAAGKEQGNRT
jgi:ribosome-binding factor A